MMGVLPVPTVGRLWGVLLWSPTKQDKVEDVILADCNPVVLTASRSGMWQTDPAAVKFDSRFNCSLITNRGGF